MAANQLERIATLVDRATAIGSKQRGMPIEADDWNAMVDVLLGLLQIERLQEQSQQTQLQEKYALAEHEHLGQVSMAWLDADLQSRLGGGPQVSVRDQLADTALKLRAMQKQVTQLSEQVVTHQRALDESAVAELDRSKSLRDFQSKFDGVANLSTLVGTLSSNVDGIKRNVDQVLELRGSLSDANGNPIDVAGLRTEVSALNSLRDSLKGADGTPLTMRQIELRLTDVENVVGTGGAGSLDSRFGALATDLENRTLESTKASISDALKGVKSDAAALESRVNAAIQSSASQTLTSANAATTQQISTYDAQQKTALDARFSAFSTTITNSTLDSAKGLIAQQMAQVPDISRSAAQAAATEVGKSVSADLKASFAKDLSTQIAASEAKTDARLKPLESGLPELKASLGGLVDAAVATSTSALQSTLNQQIATQVSTAQQQIQAGLNAQVTSTVNTSLANLDNRIQSAVTAQLPTIDARIAQGITAATKDLHTEIATEVGSQITKLDVTGQIATAVKSSTTQLQTTLSSQLASQEARLTTLISNTANTLRTETKSAIDSAITSSRADILATVDLQTTSKIDSRISTLNTSTTRIGTGTTIRIQP